MQNLDFDFEKCCSVSLSRVNVYACLVCGSYFQGRGPGTHAHTHSVEDDHHLFMNLEDGRVFCIPENYEVVDRSLKDIQHILNPLYTPEDVKKLAGVQWARTLDGSDYMPGLVGLNNMKRNDYANVIIQSLVRVPKLRCACVPPLTPWMYMTACQAVAAASRPFRLQLQCTHSTTEASTPMRCCVEASGFYLPERGTSRQTPMPYV